MKGNGLPSHSTAWSIEDTTSNTWNPEQELLLPQQQNFGFIVPSPGINGTDTKAHCSQQMLDSGNSNALLKLFVYNHIHVSGIYISIINAYENGFF
jgi:hypothetical protein